jgi:hypothetical protein
MGVVVLAGWSQVGGCGLGCEAWIVCHGG